MLLMLTEKTAALLTLNNEAAFTLYKCGNLCICAIYDSQKTGIEKYNSVFKDSFIKLPFLSSGICSVFSQNMYLSCW